MELSINDINEHYRSVQCNVLAGQIIGFIGFLTLVASVCHVLTTKEGVEYTSTALTKWRYSSQDPTEEISGPYDNRATYFGVIFIMVGLVLMCASEIYLDIIVHSKKKEIDPLIKQLRTSIEDLNATRTNFHDNAEIKIRPNYSDTTNTLQGILDCFKFSSEAVKCWQKFFEVLAPNKWLRVVFTAVMAIFGLVVVRMTPVNSVRVYQNIRRKQQHLTALFIANCTIPRLRSLKILIDRECS